jgi:hypothetical protein
VPWGIYGERLSQPIEAEKRNKNAEEVRRQSEWRGQALIVRHRWLKAVFFSVLYGACFILLLYSALGIELYSSKNWTVKSTIGSLILLLLLLIAASAAWSWVSGLVTAIFHGFSMQVNPEGVHLSGMPSLPFSAITRVGYREQVSRHGSVTTYLLIELNNQKEQAKYLNPFRALLAGYIFLFISYFRKHGETKLIQIHAGHWREAAPTIAAAIRHVNEKFSQFPVVEYSPFATLAESREESRLLQLISAESRSTGNEQNMQSMLQRFSAGQRLTDCHTKAFEEVFLTLDKSLDKKKYALDTLMRLQNQQQERSFQNLKSQTRHLPLVYLVLVAFAVMALAIRVLT